MNLGRVGIWTYQLNYQWSNCQKLWMGESHW